jgi:DMSO/TMAO reductase YedYZ molybdopterin-dependent catalytic subunit
MSESEDGVTISGSLKEKLVRVKEMWARDGRLLTGTTAHPARDRLPPGQTRVAELPVLDLGIQPEVPLSAVHLTLDGLVEEPTTLSWAALQALPQEERVNDIHCVTQWSRFDCRWEGVPVPVLLALVRPKPEARFVLLHAHDGYTTNLPLEDLARAENVVAFRYAGEPLPRRHGGPLRLVVPHLYFWKSPKWLRRIEFLAADRPGFWEVRGYHRRGDPWAEERYA